MAGSASLAVAVSVYKKLPYDPRTALRPISVVARIPFILVVNPSLPGVVEQAGLAGTL
jgi:tripartite-type tricarboxylate transporter receptor subunit TctC